MKKATFYLDDIVYNSIIIESSHLSEDDVLDIDFRTSGVYKSEGKKYDLNLTFVAFGEQAGIEKSFVRVSLTAFFEFNNLENYEGIPGHFYDNSIAMVYPFIRAFTTSIVFQANLKRKFILPTMNLTGIGEELKRNTVVE